MIAAYENRPGVVNALLDAGADKNTVNEVLEILPYMCTRRRVLAGREQNRIYVIKSVHPILLFMPDFISQVFVLF